MFQLLRAARARLWSPALQLPVRQAHTEVQLLERAQTVHPTRVAVVDVQGKKFTYEQLTADAHGLAQHLMAQAGGALAGQRVAFLSPPTYDYVAMQWAIWKSGGVAVPLSPHHTAAELAYFIEDSQCSVVLSHPSLHSNLSSVALPPATSLLLAAPATDAPGRVSSTHALPHVALAQDAMIIYTSGTTGKPKGVVTTHANIQAQISTLVDAWGWTATDRIMNVLPLHHVHGVINVVACALFCGATVDMLPKFDPTLALNRMTSGDQTLFMAVPTVYARLLQLLAQQRDEERASVRHGLARLRLMVCGSAALPAPLAEQWLEASGHVLLQRYGMTELGMVLSQSLAGPRILGTVGPPLPGVEVRISGDVQDTAEAMIGELRVKGASVFSRYWNRPQATAESFDSEGFFCTGDIVQLDKKTGQYTILGRASVDIIKSVGYKISALEIEPEVLGHPAVAECAVVGVPDPQWGERIAAVVTLKPGTTLTLDELREHCRKTLSTYKLPSMLTILPEIPRNAMGKVNKKDLVKRIR